MGYLTNRIGLYNYLSVFGGTNYIPPRSFNARQNENQNRQQRRKDEQEFF
jgi:hypothetical protein